MLNDNLYFIENTLGYKFHNINLLYQAFVPESISSEKGGENNLVFIYLGRKILEYNAARYIIEGDSWLTGMSLSGPFADEELSEFGCGFSPDEIKQKSAELLSDKSLGERFDALGFSSFTDEKGNRAKADILCSVTGAISVDCSHNEKILYEINKKMFEAK